MCKAVTKKGILCPIEPLPESDLCHVHDPSRQCGFIRRNGVPCRMVTGGGPCEHHVSGQQVSKRIPKKIPTDTQRQVINDLLAERVVSDVVRETLRVILDPATRNKADVVRAIALLRAQPVAENRM